MGYLGQRDGRSITMVLPDYSLRNTHKSNGGAYLSIFLPKVSYTDLWILSTLRVGEFLLWWCDFHSTIREIEPHIFLCLLIIWTFSSINCLFIFVTLFLLLCSLFLWKKSKNQLLVCQHFLDIFSQYNIIFVLWYCLPYKNLTFIRNQICQSFPLCIWSFPIIFKYSCEFSSNTFIVLLFAYKALIHLECISEARSRNLTLSHST